MANGMSAARFGLALATLIAVGGVAHAADRPASDLVVAGGRVAQRNCGGCHAVSGEGASPLPAAPRFRDIHNRYRDGGLEQLLREGMLRPESLPEEGSPTRHPIMPMADLGVDEVAELTAYLKSLEPAPRP
jgi:mono/diheme cytochrome c family protein